MFDHKSDQNKQLVGVVGFLAIGVFILFRLAGGPKNQLSQEIITKPTPKAESFEQLDITYRPENLKDPFTLPDDMFKNPLEQSQEVKEEQSEVEITLPPMNIKGVIISDRPSVIIDNKVLRKGERINNAKIKEITKEKIIFEYMGREIDLPTPSMSAEGLTSIPELPEEKTEASSNPNEKK
ncbi:MAG: general secretion pathway protein GspB [Candidatus Omnitrophota bacterium]